MTSTGRISAFGSSCGQQNLTVDVPPHTQSSIAEIFGRVNGLPVEITVGASKTIEQALEEAFLLGFMVTREGYNGECAFEAHAPDVVRADAQEPEADFKAKMQTDAAFKRLQAEAVERIAATL